MTEKESYVIGLMTGTSGDGVDGVLLQCPGMNLIASDYQPYPPDLKQQLVDLGSVSDCDLSKVMKLSRQLADQQLVVIERLQQVCQSMAITPAAVGCHGQTWQHCPQAQPPCTFQLVDPSYIATQSGLPVVTHFRQNDMALGGQGAPLAPAFHRAYFALEQGVAVLNLGGIANISYLDRHQRLLGYDLGPANVLLDQWIMAHLAEPYDNQGDWASTGEVIPALLSALLEHPFFRQLPPKSADYAWFSLAWLREHNIAPHSPQDVQATLAELTAQTVARAIEDFAIPCQQLKVAGGGALNLDMMRRLDKACRCEVLPLSHTIAQSLEAMMIAWLTAQRLSENPIDLTTVTGASRPSVLGALYMP